MLDFLYIVLALFTVNIIPIYSVEWRHGLPYNVPLGLILIFLSALMSIVYYIGRAIYLISFQLKNNKTYYNIKDLISHSYEYIGLYARIVIAIAFMQLLLFVWAAMGSGLLVGLTAIVLVLAALVADVFVLPCILYRVVGLGYCYGVVDYLRAFLVIGAPGMIVNFALDYLFTSILHLQAYYPYIWPLSDDAARMFNEGHEPWFPSIPSILATLIYARIIALIRELR